MSKTNNCVSPVPSFIRLIFIDATFHKSATAADRSTTAPLFKF